MNTRELRENLFKAIANMHEGQPATLSVRGLIKILTSKKDKQDFIDLLCEKNPTYFELFDFPDMDVEKNRRSVLNMFDECIAIRPDSDDLKLSRIHLDTRELSEQQLSALASHLAHVCADHEVPDVTCDTGDKELNAIWNTIFYGLSSGNGMEDVFESFYALGDALASLRKFDAMRDAYQCAISAAETNKEKAEIYFVRGGLYFDFGQLDTTLLKEKLFSLAISDLSEAHRLWPEQVNIKADLAKLYLNRGMYYASHRGPGRLEDALVDFNNADDLVAGQSVILRNLINLCRERIREVRGLEDTLRPGTIISREIMQGRKLIRPVPVKPAASNKSEHEITQGKLSASGSSAFYKPVTKKDEQDVDETNKHKPHSPGKNE